MDIDSTAKKDVPTSPKKTYISDWFRKSKGEAKKEKGGDEHMGHPEDGNPKDEDKTQFDEDDLRYLGAKIQI